MARIRVLQQGFLYVLTADDSDGDGVGSGNVTGKDGAIAGSGKTFSCKMLELTY